MTFQQPKYVDSNFSAVDPFSSDAVKTADQGWAINLALGPLCEGRIQWRAVPSHGNRSKSWLS